MGYFSSITCGVEIKSLSLIHLRLRDLIIQVVIADLLLVNFLIDDTNAFRQI